MTKSKKKYQTHDIQNQIYVGYIVQFEKSRSISKTKSMLAITVVAKNKLKSPEAVPPELGLPLEPARS
ncbi:30S ribosomal protein S17 [Nymphaea thermarum]|nr:30S ribosomal protein S17 [Nymphaea thermarum]